MKHPLEPSCCSVNLNDDEEKRLVAMAQAMGNPLRFEILKYLYTHPTCITGNIVDILPISQSTTSQHLKVLRESGWVCGTIEGTSTNYCLDHENLMWFMDTMKRAFGAKPEGE